MPKSPSVFRIGRVKGYVATESGISATMNEAGGDGLASIGLVRSSNTGGTDQCSIGSRHPDRTQLRADRYLLPPSTLAGPSRARPAVLSADHQPLPHGHRSPAEFVEDVRPVRLASQFFARDAEEFVRHLRTIEVAPNGHKNTRKRRLLDKGIIYILESCRRCSPTRQATAPLGLRGEPVHRNRDRAASP